MRATYVCYGDSTEVAEAVHVGEFETRQLQAPLTGRGFVRFIRIRPERKQRNWVCDECVQIVRPSEMRDHAREHE